MLKRGLRCLLEKITAHSPILSGIGLLVTIYGIYTFWSDIYSAIKKVPQHPTRDDLALLLGLLLLFILLGRSMARNLLAFFDPISTARCGNGKYPYRSLFDRKTKNIIIVGQTLSTLLGDPNFLPLMKTFLQNKRHVVLILSTPEAMKALQLESDFKQSVTKLRNFRDYDLNDLDDDQKGCLGIYFHLAATSLSLLIRDPESENPSRSVLVLSSKWADDDEPESRVFSVFDRKRHSGVFLKIYGKIGNIARSDTPQLTDICKQLGLYQNASEHDGPSREIS